ncbi:tyrosine-protein phosphatase [Cellulomonas fimi]|uniref:Protein tyrosine/serine phosphatase n=1 Tax=Cellulomonas fimi (strain ATCC 484 / DSM 20113 / JCM 1341 / CCUG 24087 / LMG 16345 / NBRC 15513 / NCIMB 8980 / NCTC 7547 / NRS-133) TaxID=590998 RepID=F4H7J7_CELFA|nr:tyrosine-protein phosphatase [Cellulomonas fimi]AEE44554.1 protein tyrosine/serine phosphatase [Cellulomonas fimi ATCC 484]NNH06470.1 tyrosine-protein phosphatase [Cellulomonas fimi]VEH26606.1 Tyrosine-protein phosphatase precursor [Cellulomonas fimi]
MRTLSWDGYRNVRDLGGLPTPLSATGTTRSGRVARGPRRELLTAQGREDAVRWGVRTVVDLRNADEHGPRDGDPDVAGREWVGITVVHAPTEDPTHAGFLETCGPILDSPEYWAHNVRLLPDLLRVTLEAVASAEPGVLVHCSAGRDRTGMVTALLLAHAGVPPEHVAADWAESVRAVAGRGHHADDRQSSWDEDQVEAFLAQTVPVAQEVAADVAGLLDVVGVDDDTRTRLRDLLVG